MHRIIIISNNVYNDLNKHSLWWGGYSSPLTMPLDETTVGTIFSFYI